MRYIWVISIWKSALTGWKSAYDSYEMHAQHHKGISQTIPKDDTDSQEIYTVRKRFQKMKKTQNHSFFCLLLLQRNPHLPLSTVGLLSSLSDRANLYTIHKTFILIHPSIHKSKITKHPRYTVNIRRF